MLASPAGSTGRTRCAKSVRNRGSKLHSGLQLYSAIESHDKLHLLEHPRVSVLRIPAPEDLRGLAIPMAPWLRFFQRNLPMGHPFWLRWLQAGSRTCSDGFIRCLVGPDFTLNSPAGCGLVALALGATWTAAAASWKWFEGPLVAWGQKHAY